MNISEQQLDDIIIQVLQEEIDHISEMKEKFSEEWKEDLKSFNRVLKYYGG